MKNSKTKQEDIKEINSELEDFNIIAYEKFEKI